jgi:hypothetical protein
MALSPIAFRDIVLDASSEMLSRYLELAGAPSRGKTRRGKKHGLRHWCANRTSQWRSSLRQCFFPYAFSINGADPFAPLVRH